MTWKLDDGTTNQSLEAWGFTPDAKLALRNQSVDTLELRSDLDVDVADLFDYRDQVTLYKEIDSVSTKWFVGVVVSSPRFGSARNEGHEYLVEGPWHYLDNLPFEQEWSLGSGGTVFKSRAVLGKSSSSEQLEVGEVLKQILDYVNLKVSPNPVAYVQTELDALDAIMIHDDVTAIMCGEALRRTLRWYPDVVTWFDYTTSTPTLHFTRRSDAGALSYDTSAGTVISDLSIRSRPDLQRDGVVINYERQDNSSNFNAVYQDVFPALTTSGIDTLTLTVGVGWFEQRTAVNAGIAEAIYDCVSVLHHEGQLVLDEEECSSGPRPGKVLNLTNGLTAWSTMAAVVQVVDFDLGAGKTAITFGPPAHLGVRDMIDMLMGNRKRFAGSGLGPASSAEDKEAGSPYLLIPHPDTDGLYLLDYDASAKQVTIAKVVAPASDGYCLPSWDGTERKITLVNIGSGGTDDVRALMFDDTVPKVIWGDLDYGAT